MTDSLVTRKWLFGINALSAWIGLGMSVVIEIFGLVKPLAVDPPVPTSQFAYLGHYAEGLAGAPARLIDLFSYFTIWSQIVVGIVATLLFLNPMRDGGRLRVYRLDSLVMITVTGIVYNLLLGPNYPPQGLNVYSSFFEHTLTPILTILVFIVAGPRRWFSRQTFLLALGLPIAYAIYTLIRGAIIGMYPYDFIDVVKYGYGPVLQFVAVIILAATAIMGLFWAIDELISRKSSNQDSKQDALV